MLVKGTSTTTDPIHEEVNLVKSEGYIGPR